MNKFYVTSLSLFAISLFYPPLLGINIFKSKSKAPKLCDSCPDSKSHSEDSKLVDSKLADSKLADSKLVKAPDFSLISSSGEKFSSTEVKPPYLLNLFFTRCEGPCPLTLTQLKRLKSNLKPDTELPIISITVDPEHDTPEVLKEYAKKHSVLSKDWIFLTGTLPEINKIMEDGFNVGAGDSPQTHSTRLVYINKDGEIEEYVFGTDPQEIDKLTQQINHQSSRSYQSSRS